MNLFFFKKSFTKLLFLIMVFTSTMMVMATNSWINAWLGLEINMIMFISNILNNNKIMSIESSLIYFLIQSIASIILLYSIMIYLLNNNNNLLNFNFNKITYLVIITLMMKMGAAPLHFWLPMVMNGLSWMNNYLIMTWQKIAPLILSLYSLNNMILMFVFFSSIMGPIMGMNQTNLKKMMAYSSINYSSWMLMAMKINYMLWKMFMMFYFYLLICLILLFKKMKLTSIKQLYLKLVKNLKMNLIIMLNILSMGGLPPFLGFFPKMLIMINMIYNKLFFILTFMIITNLINLYYYLRITYSTFMLNYKSNKSLMKFFNNKNIKMNILYKNLMKMSLLTNLMIIILILNFYMN